MSKGFHRFLQREKVTGAWKAQITLSVTLAFTLASEQMPRHQHQGEMKTEASQKPVPIDGALLDALQDWSSQTLYRQNGDWVFASPDKGGKQPYWPETLLKCHVHAATKRLGITKRIGWHSFRRTFATLLGGSEDVKTMQELMRHANSRLTLDLYAQALTPAKRAAHRRLVGLIQGPGERQLVPYGPTQKEAVPVSA
jgi:integrase